MSADPCDFDNFYSNSSSIAGEWVEMHFPVGTMPIHLGDDCDPDSQHYLNIQFDQGSPWFMLMKTDREDGFRSYKDECIMRFAMPVQLLERIARIGRS